MAEFAYQGPKYRARILLLSHVAQLSLARRIGDKTYGGLSDMAFIETMFGEKPVPGDLVALQSAPATKWYLSWLVSVQRPEGWCDDQYTLESIEDGELCNWTNVGMAYYDRSRVAAHPEWRWTDQQHEFNDRWFRVCHKERDAYIILPRQAEFVGDGVKLQCRVRHGFSDPLPPRMFNDWKKVTKAKMLEFYDEMVEEDKRRPPASIAS